MQIVKGYQENELLRASFCKLARETFDISFEKWYQLGLWSENYIPYSVVIDGQVAANVSVNRTMMQLDSHAYDLIQLGTVMTAINYRRRGYIRELFKHVEKDYADKSDGIYLFANKNVLDLYPKFGFIPLKEHQYVNKYDGTSVTKDDIVQYKLKSDESIRIIKSAIENRGTNCRFQMIGNSSLPMFHLSSYLSDKIYYCPGEDAYTVSEMDQDEILIYDIYSADNRCDLSSENLYPSTSARKIKLGFVPSNYLDFDYEEIKDEDTTLFAKGTFFDIFEQNKLMFPLLCHA